MPALPSSGPISIGDINAQKSLTRTAANSSLSTLSTTNVNSNSTSKPDGAQPHFMSEFYGYDHDAVAYSVTITGGSVSNESDVFSISWTGTGLPGGGYYTLEWSDTYVNTTTSTINPATSTQDVVQTSHSMDLIASGDPNATYNELAYTVYMKNSGGTTLASAGGVLGFYYDPTA